MSGALTSQAIRGRLSHPVIDADGHQIEFEPLLIDYLREEGGAALVDAARASVGELFGWYELDPAERRRRRAVRPPWGLPAERTDDVAACMLPGLFRSRMDELGIDYAILYPTLGLAYVRTAPPELRSPVCRAINRYYADAFRDHADRLTAAAVIPMHTPEQAIAELDHAIGTLGMKTIVIDCAVARPVQALADRRAGLPPSLARFMTWLDTFGTDSDHDYDPFWARCLELGVSPTAHMAGMWGTRTSISSYVHNHLGMFAAAGEALCRSLFLAGVTFRFPELQIGFLEGGAGWACSLYADLIEHWEKRSYRAVEAYDPARLDRARLRQLLAEHGGPRLAGLLDDRPLEESCRGLFLLSGWVPEAGWEPRDRALLDEFARCEIQRAEDVRDHFAPSFFFGCEAEDPSVAWALDGKSLPFGTRLQVMFGSDIGHWDVTDMRSVLAEAYEAVERGRLDREAFQSFTFDSAVRLHGRHNPAFFRGTAVEREAEQVLARSRDAEAAGSARSSHG
jgi:predicted TIM-barrel fold metal-dependent hydrolase